MRGTLLCVMLATAGCAQLASSITHLGTAVGLGLEAATVAVLGGVLGQSSVSVDAEVSIASEAATPQTVYQTWIVARTACATGREYHLRCVRAQQGQACFFETDDGFAYDCVDADCKRVPPELGTWCSAGGAG